jgi:hypothetical protein
MAFCFLHKAIAEASLTSPCFKTSKELFRDLSSWISSTSILMVGIPSTAMWWLTLLVAEVLLPNFSVTSEDPVDKVP